MFVNQLISMTFKKIVSAATISFYTAGLLISCNYKEKTTTVEITQTANIDSIAASYYEEYLSFYPLEATSQGDIRFNNQLPISISRESIANEIAFLTRFENELKNIDYNSLSNDKKVIYDVLKFKLQNEKEKFEYNPQLIPFTQFGGLPLDFPLLGSGEGSQPFKTIKDYENWLERMSKFPLWMDAAIVNFKSGIDQNVVLPKVLVAKMIAQMNASELVSTDFNKNIFSGPTKIFPAEFDAETRADLTSKYKASIASNIIPAYKKMHEFLATEYLAKARTTTGYNSLPNGDKIYKYQISNWTTTNLGPEEIHTIGLQEVARIRKEMAEVQKTLKYNGTLEEFLAHLKKDEKAMPYETSKEILKGFNDILLKITPKLETMFSVTPKTPFEIRQTEKFREATASAEYVQGTPDGKRPGIFYMPIPSPKNFNVTSGMESLFLHEAIPGHHYQISLQQENETLPKFMRFGWFGAYGEGWALYCESLGQEFGLYTDPYQKMGALSDEMMRAVRLVVDTALHTGKMSREEAIKYFLSNVSYDEASATAEIERYMAMPGQALSYKIGALKIKDLRTKYQNQQGSKFNIASFHDEILSQGCLPLSVLERKMALWAETKK